MQLAKRVSGCDEKPKVAMRYSTITVILLAMLAPAVAQSSGPDPGDERRFEQRKARITSGYSDLWLQLDSAIDDAVETLDSKPLGSTAVLRTFEALEEVAALSSDQGLTLLLFDGNRRPVAWAGKGLLHDVDVARLPDGGRHHLASFSAVTLLVVESLFDSGAPWHLIVGRSLRVDDPPFRSGFESSMGETVRWTVVSRTAPVDGRHLRIDLPGSPILVIDLIETAPERSLESSVWKRVLILAGGLLLLTMTWLRSWGWLTLLLGLAALGISAVAPWWSILILLTGAGLTFWAWRTGPKISHRLASFAWGLGVSAVAVVIGWFSQAWHGPVDLGSQLLGPPSVWVGRLAVFGVIFGLFLLIGSSDRVRKGGRDLLSGCLLALVFLAAASYDMPVVSGVLLLGIGGLTALWCRQSLRPHRASHYAFLVLISALVSGTSWELSYHQARKAQIAVELLPAMAPPTDAQFDRVVNEVEGFLARIDLSDFSPARVTDLQRQDLAFEIWHDSPLAGSGALSALVVELPDSAPSSFSFGLPLAEEEFVDLSPLRWGLATIPVWKDAVFHGISDLTLAGQPWARVRYWLALAPGFRLPIDQDEDLTAGLLRVGPRRREPRRPDLQGVEYVLYDPSGQPLLSPWRQSPRLSEALLKGGTGRTRVGDRSAEVATAVGSDGVRALFYLCPSTIEALERVGAQALTCVMAAFLLALLLQIPMLRAQGLARIWTRIWRSYSSRLVVVYSILVLLPVLLMNLVVVRGQEERLRREQENAGETALESAQRVLAEYVWELEPGFGIDSALDNELLSWLSGVVHHDVNLYWRSRVSSSSKSELFKAGLLPERIPGEIFSRLTLLNHDIALRTNRAGSAEYLELYAPLTVPGMSRETSRLFLSLPMLAQQEETAAQIASLRSGAVLGTASVMLILLAIGTRLARRFTTPLTEIVRGTQRIAAGDRSLNLAPQELELATLVEAIDQMAEKIAEGRQSLLREKRVVDRMVDNITSGVVSLDADQRVVMANRVAIEMLGVGVGDPIESVLSAEEYLVPVLDFLNTRSGQGPMAETVQLEDSEGEQRDWSLVWVPVPGEREPSALLVVEEVTEVLRGQRLEAWAEMARMIAHEIKNPLTPIRLSAEHMREIYASDRGVFEQVFETCTTNILRQVDELQEIASDFSTYSRIPKIELQLGDLRACVEEMYQGYRSAPPPGIEMLFHPGDNSREIEFDAKLLARAIRNLIENAIRATGPGGQIDLSVSIDSEQAKIVVADTGTGVSPAILQRIFDPYFSTHDSGTGLGLPIARQIVEEHGGTISARNRSAAGLELVITLPAG
jgi:signal transduction histidine kinase